MNVHPLIQEVIDERAEIDARVAALKAAAAMAWDEHGSRLAAWQEVRDDAIAEGRVPSPAPDPPDLSEIEGEQHRLRVRREGVGERQEKVLAELLPDLEAEAVVEMGEVLDQARSHAEVLAGLAVWASDILRPIHQARGAADNRASRRGPSRRQARSHRVPVTVGDLLRAVAGDIDLLAVAPMPVRSDTEPHVDRSAVEQPALGLTKGVGWGTPPPDPPRRRRSRDRFT